MIKDINKQNIFFYLILLSSSLFCITPAFCQENPDEYRDCIVYTLEEADATTAPTGNQVIFTFSGLMTRAEVNNVDCKIISYIDEPSSDEDDNDNSNGGDSIIGGGSGNSSSSGNNGSSSGGSSSGGSSSGSSSSGGSGSSCSNSEGNSSVHAGGCN